jgi:hypothetical protein
VLDTWSRSVVGKRIYSGEGLLLRRHFSDRWDGTFTNSITGATAGYQQRNVYCTTWPSRATRAPAASDSHPPAAVTDQGATVLESGRIVIAHEDDAVVFASGKHAIADYYDNGDESPIQPICDALT